MMAGLSRNLRRLSATGLIALLVLSAFTRIVSASLSTVSEDAPEAPMARGALLCPPSDEVSMLLDRIAARDEALGAREDAAALREQDVAVARQEIAASLVVLTEAEARLAERMAQSSTAAEGDVGRLVTVYEGMKPKDAALLFGTMEPAFAAGFLARMDAGAASAIFSNLPPDTAYALSVLMAGRNANAATE